MSKKNLIRSILYSSPLVVFRIVCKFVPSHSGFNPYIFLSSQCSFTCHNLKSSRSRSKSKLRFFLKGLHASRSLSLSRSFLKSQEIYLVGLYRLLVQLPPILIPILILEPVLIPRVLNRQWPQPYRIHPRARQQLVSTPPTSQYNRRSRLSRALQAPSFFYSRRRWGEGGSVQQQVLSKNLLFMA